MVAFALNGCIPNHHFSSVKLILEGSSKLTKRTPRFKAANGLEKCFEMFHLKADCIAQTS
jgi:hypothetical protein